MANNRSIATMTYDGHVVECAKIVVNDTADLKLPLILPHSGSYIFQMVILTTDANKTVTLRIGDKTRDVEITTTARRIIESFQNVSVAESNDVYIDFPNGTYYIYNVQLEEATNASSWRPAPEDAEQYTDDAVAALDQEEIVRRLTNNFEQQGLYLQNGNLYVNASYIHAGTLEGIEIRNGSQTFHVDEYGNCTANSFSSSNANITGGKINISTVNSYDSAIDIGYNWSGGESDHAVIKPAEIYVYMDNPTYGYVRSEMQTNAVAVVRKHDGANMPVAQLAADSSDWSGVLNLRRPDGKQVIGCYYDSRYGGVIDGYTSGGIRSFSLDGVNGLRFFSGNTVTKTYPVT